MGMFKNKLKRDWIADLKDKYPSRSDMNHSPFKTALAFNSVASSLLINKSQISTKIIGCLLK